MIRKIIYNRFTKKRKLKKIGFVTKFYRYLSYETTIEAPVYVNGEASIHKSVSIGKYTYIQGSCRISPDVEIGRYCSIAGGVNIAPTDHPVNWITTHPIAYDTERYFGKSKTKSYELL